MGAALLAVGIELLIGIGIGLIVTVIGLFFGNIIVFDSIALAILAGFLSHGLLGVHPALAVVIGIAVLLGLLLLLRHLHGKSPARLHKFSRFLRQLHNGIFIVGHLQISLHQQII